MIEIGPLPQGAIVGDVTKVTAKGARTMRCAVRHHDGGDAVQVDLRFRPGCLEGEFKPDRAGRWWVAFEGDRETKEACFWVAPRRV